MVAADIKSSALVSSQLDRILGGESRRIEQSFYRHFYPVTEARAYKLSGGAGFWLNADLLSITSATEDGVAVDLGDRELYPSQYGPPYSWVELSGETVVITGEWGYSADTVPAGALAEALDSSETGVNITDSSKVGVGDLIKVDTERMLVTARSLLDTTANLNDTLAASDSDTTVTVSNGALVSAGEVITIESERMLVVDIASNDLLVERAYDGSTLATHSGALDVYAPRTLTVERAATGSTVDSHLDAAAITKYQAPSPIRNLCMAEALSAYEQEKSAYGRVVGSGEGQREAAGKGLEDVRSQAGYYRRFRMASI